RRTCRPGPLSLLHRIFLMVLFDRESHPRVAYQTGKEPNQRNDIDENAISKWHLYFPSRVFPAPFDERQKPQDPIELYRCQSRARTTSCSFLDGGWPFLSLVLPIPFVSRVCAVYSITIRLYQIVCTL